MQVYCSVQLSSKKRDVGFEEPLSLSILSGDFRYLHYMRLHAIVRESRLGTCPFRIKCTGWIDFTIPLHFPDGELTRV